MAAVPRNLGRAPGLSWVARHCAVLGNRRDRIVKASTPVCATGNNRAARRPPWSGPNEGREFHPWWKCLHEVRAPRIRRTMVTERLCIATTQDRSYTYYYGPACSLLSTLSSRLFKDAGTGLWPFLTCNQGQARSCHGKDGSIKQS